MKKGSLGLQSGWDVLAAVAAILLYGNFLAFIVLLFAAIGMLLLYPEFSIVTSVLLLCGILMHFITRRKTAKLWRRLLFGSVAANLLIVAFYILAVAVFAMAWIGR